MKIKAVYYGFSVYINRQEQTRLSSDDGYKFKIIPALNCIEVTSESPRYGTQTILTPMYNVKYMVIEKEENSDDKPNDKESTSRTSKEKPVSSSN